ncbi:MAG: AAA family ATPase [Chloroflexi bacterium]|nr:AAA family ATPase [Chloroflexota bacterium]
MAKLKRNDSPEYPPITLKRLTLHNIKCFKHLELSFNEHAKTKSWTVLVGDNGVGKTTILHCIALCALGPALASKIVDLPQKMLRLGAKKGSMEAVFEAFPKSTDSGPPGEVVIRLNIEDISRTFEVDLQVDAPGFDSTKKFIDARKRTDFEGWFTAGYGAVRNLLFTDKPSKIDEQDPLIERIESLFDPTKLLIEPSSLNRFLSGDASPFKEMGAPSTLEPETTKTIRELLDKLLPMISFKAPNGSGSLDTPFGKVPIAELSEGYKSMLSWLAHLIMHLLRAVNWQGNITGIKGIVLIDEVDLHLHPGWQQQVIPILKECFPNLQFIGSTHSPMTAGGADDGEIILLQRDESEIKATQELHSIKGWRADQILTSRFFGLESSRDLATRKLLAEYSELLGIPAGTTKQKERIKYLESTLKDLIPPTGETEIERQAFRLIEDTMQTFLNKQPTQKKEKLLKEIKRQLKGNNI